jgi:membrane protein implicated in regulation of membrane protease activity
MQFRRLVIEFIALVIIGFVIVVAGSVIAGVDTAIYPAWMWISSLVVIIFLAAIIAVLLVRWQDSLYDEGTPDEDTPEGYRDLRE